jgi:glycosyltransferase 2 family protein
VAALGMLTIAIGWRQCLLALGGRVSIREALRQYFVGELGKYVPGGVWTVVGRGELARTSGLSRVSSYGATLVSISIAYLAAIGTAGATALIADVGGEGWWVALTPLLVPVAILALHPRAIRLGLDLVSKLGRRPSGLELPSWATGIRLMLLHVPAWIAIGIAMWLVALSLDATTPDLANILFAAVVSWVAGMLAIPVPGGIGVREAVFVALATTLSSPGIAAAVAITSRLLFILVDTCSALLVTFLARKSSSTSTQP